MKIELCPFHDPDPSNPNLGKAVLLRELPIAGQRWTAVRCKDCGAIGPHFLSSNPNAYELAITLWNVRRSNNG